MTGINPSEIVFSIIIESISVGLPRKPKSNNFSIIRDYPLSIVYLPIVGTVMDISRIIEKPANRKDVITLSKPEEKINEIIFFYKKANPNW